MTQTRCCNGVATLLLLGVHLLCQATLVHPERLAGLRLLDMTVPTVADPREPMTLSCSFDMGGEELNSVKWYKDEQEFFRYMPLQHPPVLVFPVAGVHLDTTLVADDDGHRSCTDSQCTVTLRNLTRVHSSGAYKCEVSTEAPTFRVVFSSTNVTVVALPRGSPRVEGLAPLYSTGDQIVANCTSGPADPPPTLVWHLNGKPLVSRALVGPNIVSEPDEQGLVYASLGLHLVAEKRHFPGPGATMEVRCVAASPAVPQPPLHTAHTVTLKGGNHAHHLNNQKLEWPNSGAAGGPASRRPATVCNLVTTCIATAGLLLTYLLDPR